jgi:hypothetical protein
MKVSKTTLSISSECHYAERHFFIAMTRVIALSVLVPFQMNLFNTLITITVFRKYCAQRAKVSHVSFKTIQNCQTLSLKITSKVVMLSVTFVKSQLPLLRFSVELM